MKTIIFSVTAFFAVLFITCDKVDVEKKVVIETSSISFTGCSIALKSTIVNRPKVRLIGQAGGKLTVKMINTEFCCGTDSISFDASIDLNNIRIDFIDNGPFTYCYCPHTLEFSLSSLEDKTYELTLIESEHSYSRDTFLIQFNYTEQLDTTISGSVSGNGIGEYPLEYLKTDLGGCNGTNKFTSIDNEGEIDTLIFSEHSETIKIFAGLNLTCCIDFVAESELVGDTLMMRINTMNDDFCDCICYYTFDYSYSNYIKQGFYYQYYIDDFKKFEGKYNLP